MAPPPGLGCAPLAACRIFSRAPRYRMTALHRKPLDRLGRHPDPFLISACMRRRLPRWCASSARCRRCRGGRRGTARVSFVEFMRPVCSPVRCPIARRAITARPLRARSGRDRGRPNRFPPVLSDLDLYLRGEALTTSSIQAGRASARARRSRVSRSVLAPNARRVIVVGDFIRGRAAPRHSGARERLLGNLRFFFLRCQHGDNTIRYRRAGRTMFAAQIGSGSLRLALRPQPPRSSSTSRLAPPASAALRGHA